MTPLQVLEQAGHQDDHAVQIGESLLAFSHLQRLEVSSSRIRSHFEKLARCTLELCDQALAQKGGDVRRGDLLRARGHAIYRAIFEVYGYTAQAEQGGLEEKRAEEGGVPVPCIIHAIQSRSLSAPLCVGLYLEIAERCGWAAGAMAVPGCWLLRMSDGAEALLCDPMTEHSDLNAQAVRGYVKRSMGEDRELCVDYYQMLHKRAFVIAVQNRWKLVCIAQGDYETALTHVQAMQLFAPNEYRLLLDSGVLYAKTGQVQSALFALRRYIPYAPDAMTRTQVEALIDALC